MELDYEEYASILGKKNVPFRVVGAEQTSLADFRRQPVILIGAINNKFGGLIWIFSGARCGANLSRSEIVKRLNQAFDFFSRVVVHEADAQHAALLFHSKSL